MPSWVRDVSDEKLRECVVAAASRSDSQMEDLVAWGRIFVEAHRARPGGASLEVGTREGGSALLWLSLLDVLYRPALLPPTLFTVDPYGMRPYQGGEGRARLGMYGDAEYISAKRALAPYANHVHFHVTSEVFLRSIMGLHYWAGGRARGIGNFTFALLDGQHDFEMVYFELTALLAPGGMAPGGLIVVDNTANDPRLGQAIATEFDALPGPTPSWDSARWAIVRGRKL